MRSPHIFTRKPRLRPLEFLILGAKRLLQHGVIPGSSQTKAQGISSPVPDDAVLDVPNKYGKAVVWYSKSWRSTVTGQEGGFYIRCFLPGELY